MQVAECGRVQIQYLRIVCCHECVVTDVVWDIPQLFSLIGNRDAGMYCLHTQNLIIALFVVKHGRSKVVEYILGRERAVGLYLVNAKTVNYRLLT